MVCAGLEGVPPGFWYCDHCTHLILTGHHRDLTTDFHLMRYVFLGIPPPDDQAGRVTRFSGSLRVHQGKLFISGKEGWREVPSLAERYNIIHQYHGLSHAHPDKLYQGLKKWFFW